MTKQPEKDYTKELRTKILEALGLDSTDQTNQDAINEIITPYFGELISRSYDAGLTAHENKVMSRASAMKKETLAMIDKHANEYQAFCDTLKDCIVAWETGNPLGIPLRPRSYYESLLMVREPELQSLLRIREYIISQVHG